MSIELSIFKMFCKDREKQLLHNKHIEGLPRLEKELKTIFKLLDSYYEVYEDENCVSSVTFLDYFELTYPKDKRKEDISTIVGMAFEQDTNEVMVNTLLDQLNEKHVATHMVNKLMPVLEGEKYGVLADLGIELDEYVETLHNPPAAMEVPTPCEETFTELMEEEINEPGLPWRLPGVTNIVGGIKPATLGLIYAYVDSGKTSFCLDNVAFWSQFLGDNEYIAYCGNEEIHKRLKRRSAQAFLKENMTYLRENIEEAQARLDKSNYEKILYFKDMIAGQQIEYVLKTYKPRILIIDQATHVDIKAKRRAEGVGYLEQLFQWYRRLANRYETAILGVSQGVGDAENTKWLKLSDIYGSKVAIQGALDYAIGVGRKTDDAAVENLRYLNFPKNKLNDGEGGRITTHFIKQNCEWSEV